MYKLIALDMDGTLLNEKKEISKGNQIAIDAVKSEGKKVIIATGRPLKGVESYLDKLGMNADDDYVVAFNGALVQNVKTGEVISKTVLSYEDYEYLYKLSMELDVNIHFLTEDEVVTPKHNKYTEVEATINGINIVEESVEASKGKTVVKVMFIDSKEKLDKIENMIPKEVKERYNVLRSADIFLEFLHKSVNKGTGVKAVAEQLGLNQSNVISVGDAGNDVDMIMYAGLGVAMGNGYEEVKKVADYITLSNEKDGVAHVIHKYMIGA